MAVACVLLFSARFSSAYEARITWSPVAEAIGYKIYVRQNADAYGTGMDVGALQPDADGLVRYPLRDLPLAARASFAVTTYDATGRESPRSNEFSLDYATVAPFVDSDGDGLSDAQEDVNLNRVVDAGETDPRRADSDGDGLSDGAEIQIYRTNPLAADSDGDEFADGNEIAAGSDPNDAGSRPPLCGNGSVNPGEVCDGADDDACPTVCLSNCTCPRYVALPLAEWSRLRGDGSWSVQSGDPETQGPVLVTEALGAPTVDFAIAYPASPALGVPFPLLAFTLRAAGPFIVEVVVSSTSGRTRVLAYQPNGVLATVLKERAAFPIDTAAGSGSFRTTYRDLAADLRAAFGLTLARVQQVRLYGDLSAASIVLADRVDVSGNTGAGLDSVGLPLAGWAQKGRGAVFANEHDAELDGPTLRSEPAGPKMSALMLDYPPARGEELIARFRTISLFVRDEEGFAVELKLWTSDGRVRKLRYKTGRTTAKIQRRRAILPLGLLSVPGSSYRLATFDLAADLARLHPGATLAGVRTVCLQGKFQVGNVVFSEAIE